MQRTRWDRLAPGPRRMTLQLSFPENENRAVTPKEPSVSAGTDSRRGFTKVLYGARPDGRVDWDGSNARERLPERRRFATAARTRAGPEGAHGDRGPGQHRGRGIP